MRQATISELARMTAAARPVLFLGAGVSIASPSSLPLAGQLIDAFIAALTGEAKLAKLAAEIPDGAFHALRSPEIIYNAVAEYAAGLVPRLFRAALASERPNANHWIAAQLLATGRIERIVTTNFDPLIERCLSDDESRVDVRDDDRGAGIWKIHGDLQRQMSIALRDVVLIGFSPMPMLLARALTGRTVVVAGYSGNDLHVIRAVAESGAREIWWIVRPGDDPPAARLLGPLVRLVPGDLAHMDDGNPFVAIWSACGTTAIPGHVLPDDHRTDLRARLVPLLDEIDWRQRAFIFHSMIRRAGVKMTERYRKQMSSELVEAMWKQGASPGIGYTPGEDWLSTWESHLTPHLLCQSYLLSRLEIEPADDDDAARVRQVPQWMQEAQLLLDAGVEYALRGDLDHAAIILDAAARSAKAAALPIHETRAQEAASWVAFARGDADAARAHHDVVAARIEQIALDVQALRQSKAQSFDDILRGLDPPDEPTVYRTLHIDRRFRPVVQALRAAARLRHHGYADLALRVLDGVLVPKVSSRWLQVLEAFLLLEKGCCQFDLFAIDEALELMSRGESALRVIDDVDLEPGRQFSRTVGPYYVRAGRLAQALGASLSSSRIA